MPITAAEILAVSGQAISVNVGRDEDDFTFDVEITATAAQTVEVHQAMTTDVGFANANSATKSVVATSTAPVCNVEIQSFTFESYGEKSDWSGPMVSTFSGEVYAESTCLNLMATIALVQCDTSASVVS